MDGLRLMKGVPRLEIAVRRDVGVCGSRLPAKVGALACGGSAMETSSASDPASVSSRQSYVFPLRMMLLWPGGRGGGLMEKGSGEAGAEDEEKREEAEEVEEAEEEAVVGEKRGNWVQNILRVGSIWPRKEEAAATDNREEEAAVVEKGDVCVGAGCAHGIVGCVVGGEAAERMAFDRESFSRFLRRVTLAEARLFGKMAYLCSLAYIIPKIKPKGLLKRYALRFVTSSFDRRGKSSASDKKQTPVQDQELEEEISRAEGNNEKSQNSSERKENGTGINDFVAYRIAASAASYLQSKTIGILPFNSAKSETSNDPTEESGENEEKGTLKSLKEVSFVATTNSVTAVVAGKEEMKDAVAKDLNSAKNSPCEWYICDDDSSSTRFFVIQGSESLASWQANLLFEPIQFEKLLYAPMGRLLILQPEDEFSPHHHLLPPGSGLYVFGNSSTDSDDSERLLQAARSAFINSPHPLEILSDRTAYGSAGAVSRDHDMRSYLTSVRAVIRHELILIRKVKREQCRRKVWWPLLITVGTGTTKRHSSFSSFFPGERNQ
ncbi:Lipase (class 3) [Musa troglodytarum]|uniref:Lipase (Class 3) n=1 Tax=Musa troglodytarum TaxID=320322 RepID=A0A9E7ELW6_9LILI|nr:Lipase (class 3) [Musa troglodytarum]